MPLISIIVTTKDRPDFLFRCLTAIQRQTLEDFECIIVGDNCRHFFQLLEHFDDDRFSFVSSINMTPNVGAIGKNVGIKYSTTDIIAYCNDDDILLPNHAEVCYNNIQGYELLFTTFIEALYGDVDEYEILSQPLYSKGPKHREGYKDNISICHTKKLWELAGHWKPLEEVGYNEDGYFIPKLYYHAYGKINKVKDVTAIYNQHSNPMKEPYSGTYYQKLKTKKGVFVYPELCERLLQV